MKWKWAKVLAVASIGLGAGGAMGCSEEREPINRVQANALAKSFFVGEDLASHEDNPRFYANGTLLDVGYGASQSNLFTAWYANDLSIIKWEVTEDLLIGRLAYERINDSDGKGAGDLKNDGQVLYAFKIESHFDIRRAYNSSTGEEQNVIEENTSDRPWYEREYFRVDWSENMQTDSYNYDNMALIGMFDGIEYTPVNYYVNDPSHPHAPRFEPEDGYFDITTKAWAAPQMVDISHLGWGISNIPACFFDADLFGGSAPAANCDPTELTIRHSFWKAPDNDYQPDHWDGYQFSVAGPFLKERRGFARKYGMTDDQWYRFISRYNIWDRSHYYDDPENMTGAVECYTPETTIPTTADPNRDEDGNGTADECEAVGSGSQCDVFKQKCTLPFQQRGNRPIVWYYTTDSDPRYYEGTQWATDEWDAAIRLASNTAKYAECKRIGLGAECDAAYPVIHGGMTEHRDFVETLQEVNTCKRAGGGESCVGEIDRVLGQRGIAADSQLYGAIQSLASLDNHVILCHSPIEANDHEACAPGKPRLPADITAADCFAAGKDGGDAAVRAQCERAYNVRIGDVRYHLINVVEDPETPSPWGFGPTFADPLTGEAISASINVWTWPTDFISQFTVDQARFTAGELSVEDVTDGTFVRDWAKAADIANNGSGSLSPMTRGQYDNKVSELKRAATRDLRTGDNTVDPAFDIRNPGIAGDLDPGVMNHIKKMGRIAKEVRADALAPSLSAIDYRQRREQAMGTVTESELTTKAMLEYAGIAGSGLPADAMMEYASPLRTAANPSIQREMKNLREQALAERGACMLWADDFAPSPTALVGLSQHLQTKFGAFNSADDVDTQLARAERMQEYMAQRMHFAVMIHEMGHTFGYRHNFVSSSNAFNFRPQYWQLRTKNGTVSDVCTDLAEGEAAANCVGPRYFDPVTQEESDGLINMWAHSSVMDYAGEITQDLLGLGAYDFHAARMFYGGVATVFESEDYREGGDRAGAIVETILDSFGGIIGYTYQWGESVFDGGIPLFDNKSIHYSELNNYYNLIGDCQTVDPNAFRASWYNEERDGAWHPTLDGHLVAVNGQYSRCKQQRVDYVRYQDLVATSDPNAAIGTEDNQAGGIGPAFDTAGRLRFPYPFATDRWADLGNLAVYRHDSGADAYELFNFLITEQELRHIFDNYRRDRSTFTVSGAANRVAGRYNGKMRDGAKGLGLIKNNVRNGGIEFALEPNTYFASLVDFYGWNDNMLASGIAFDHFTRQFQRPQPGFHVDSGLPNGLLVFDAFANAPDVIISDGPQGFWNAVGYGGKALNNDLASDKGEYDAEYTINAGAYYDKLYTTMMLTESVDNFISSDVEDFLDPRFRSVSMADVFPDGYRRWLANNLTDDEWVKGARVATDAFGAPQVGPDGFLTTPIGWTSWWTDTPQTCFPNSQTEVCNAYNAPSGPFKEFVPANTRPLDAQVGWEQQKFLIAWTLVYLPENQKQYWLDQMEIYEIGADNDPGFANRIELHVPTGEIYVARTYGTEEICFEASADVPSGCKTVQRGIGARILEYANELLNDAYVMTPVTQGDSTWYVPVMNPTTGQPIVKFDPNMGYLNPTNFPYTGPGTIGCTPDPDPLDADYSAFDGCTCNDNVACLMFEDYISVPDFMRQALADFGMGSPQMKGIYQ